MSRGSVVPLFLEQANKGTLSITDIRMTRFSITINEGVDFVINCLSKMWGGEIFVPKIPSYKIVDVAKAVLEKGKLKIIGLRPGEKLHEEMITQSDSINTLEFKDYFVILPSSSRFLSWNLKDFIKNFENYKPKYCKENFSYNSLNNENFLTIKQIKNLIKNHG
jgi:FlaA1/EpsC-like NDP-sugar epimerase